MIANLPIKRITVTNISQRFTHKMAAKNGWHGYEQNDVTVTLWIYTAMHDSAGSQHSSVERTMKEVPGARP